MTKHDPTTDASHRPLSGWELVSELADQPAGSWPDLANALTDRLVDAGLAISVGVWHVDGQSQEVRLVAHRDFTELPWLTDPVHKPDHEQWLSAVFVRGQPLTWSPPTIPVEDGEDRSWPTVFAARTGRSPDGIIVLEAMPNADAQPFEPDAFGELLAELAMLMERRMRGEPAAPQAPPPVVETPKPAPTVASPKPHSVVNVRPQITSPTPTPAPTVTPSQPTATVAPAAVSAPPAPRIQVSPARAQPAAPAAAAAPPSQPQPIVLPEAVAKALLQSMAGQPPNGVLPMGQTAPGGVPPAAAAPSSPATAPHHPAWEKLVQLSLSLQRTLGVKDVASVGANDGRVWLGCDRVTVLIGRQPKVAAVSGLTRLSRRSPWVRTVERLAHVVVKGGVPLSFPEEDVVLPDAIEKPLGDYLAEGHSRMVRMVPLKVANPLPVMTEDQDQRRQQQAKTIGCLLVEQLTEGEIPDDWGWRADQLARCIARPLANAQAYDSVFLLPLWRAIGLFWQTLRGRKLWTWLGIVTAVAAFTAAMVLVPWDYRVEAEGLLLPADKREVFVPMDGEVREVLVTSGQKIAKGDLLARLENRELEADLVAVSTQLDEKRKLHRALQFQADQALKSGRRDDELRLFGQMEEAREQIIGLSKQVEILTDRKSKLEVRAPVDGTVATFQVDQLLLHRPVQRGEILLSIMNEAGPWQLELNVEEARLGHIVRAQEKVKAPLPIEFVLVMKPEQHFVGHLKEVATRATLNDEQQLVVRSVADLDADLGDQRRIGAEVRARIACGTKPLGYVLFGDVIEFMQRYLWW
jgi:multidrug efflux pump subunit AcrA (membrane-fusion protein)